MKNFIILLSIFIIFSCKKENFNDLIPPISEVSKDSLISENNKDTIVPKTFTYMISIYGSNNCALTKSFVKSCTDSALNFHYYNIYEDTKYKLNMWEIVDKFSLSKTGTTVGTPVVKIDINTDTYAFVQPKFEYIRNFINEKMK